MTGDSPHPEQGRKTWVGLENPAPSEGCGVLDLSYSYDVAA